MARGLADDLIYENLSVVEEIPAGKGATYRQIARLIDRTRNAQLVGRVVTLVKYYGRFQCDRVVNHIARLARGREEQRELIEAENVGKKDENHVDIKKYQWEYYK